MNFQQNPGSKIHVSTTRLFKSQNVEACIFVQMCSLYCALYIHMLTQFKFWGWNAWHILQMIVFHSSNHKYLMLVMLVFHLSDLLCEYSNGIHTLDGYYLFLFRYCFWIIFFLNLYFIKRIKECLNLFLEWWRHWWPFKFVESHLWSAVVAYFVLIV